MTIANGDAWEGSGTPPDFPKISELRKREGCGIMFQFGESIGKRSICVRSLSFWLILY